MPVKVTSSIKIKRVINILKVVQTLSWINSGGEKSKNAIILIKRRNKEGARESWYLRFCNSPNEPNNAVEAISQMM